MSVSILILVSHDIYRYFVYTLRSGCNCRGLWGLYWEGKILIGRQREREIERSVSVMVEILGKEERDPLNSGSMHSGHWNSVEAFRVFHTFTKVAIKNDTILEKVCVCQVRQLHLFVSFSGKRPTGLPQFPT